LCPIFLNLYCEIINTNFGDIFRYIYIYIYIIYIFISLLFFLFSNPNFNLGFNPTSSNYYLIIIILIILFNAQTYKLQQDALSFMLVSFVLINHSYLYVCSFYDSNMVHKIRKSNIVLVYNFEYYSHPSENAPSQAHLT
jgi:hypothetical protein